MKYSKLFTIAFSLVIALYGCGDSSSTSSKNKVKSKGETSNITYDKALPGGFVTKKDRSYSWIVPTKEAMKKFPLMEHSGPIKYFLFIEDYKLKNPSKFDVKEIKKYSHVKGFEGYYKTIETNDIYDLHDKKDEIIKRLKKCQREYITEYNQYLNTIFIFKMPQKAVLKEIYYDLVTKKISTHVDIWSRHYENSWVLTHFSKQGLNIEGGDTVTSFWNKLSMSLSVEDVRKCFSGAEGSVGNRITRSTIRFFVIPRIGSFGWKRYNFQEMQLIKGEMLVGSDKFIFFQYPLTKILPQHK